jgi:trigger factor
MDHKKFTVTLGQYKGVKRPAVSTEVTQEEVDALMKQEQAQHAQLAKVEAPAKLGNTVVIDFAGFLGEEQFEGGNAEGYALELGSGSFIPGFEEQLVGASAGENVEVNVTFPENYHAENLAGQPVVFRCKVHEVQEKQLPQLDDSFAKAYGLNTYEELLEAARQTIAQQKAQQNQTAVQNAVIDAIVADAKIELAPAYVEECIRQMVGAFAQNLSTQGISLEQYLEYTGATREQLGEQMRPQAEAGARATAVMMAVAEAEGISVSEEELDAEVRRMAESYDMDVEEVKKGMTEDNRDTIRTGMTASKALAFVIDAAVES